MDVLFQEKKQTLEKFLTQVNIIMNSNIFLIYNNDKYYIIDQSEIRIKVQINWIYVTKNIFWNIKDKDKIRIFSEKKLFEGIIINDVTSVGDKLVELYDVKLPFCFPRIKTYPYFTALVATLDSYNVADNWIYNNYILIWMLGWTHDVDYWADFKYGEEERQETFCKQLNKKVVSRFRIKIRYGSIIDFIVKSVKEKNYIFIGVDTFFIHQWWEEGMERKHHRHQVYVYGYNEVKQYVIMADFIGGEYKSIDVPFEQFMEAYNNYDEAPVVYVKYGQKVWLISYNANNVEEIDLERIIYLLEDFLNSKDTKIKSYLWYVQTVGDIKFGLDYYDEMLKAIKEHRNDKVDYRIIHILVELNTIMRGRMQYLEKKGNIIFTNSCRTNLEILISEINKVQNLAIKYSITMKDSYFEQLVKCAGTLKERQEKVFSMCLQCIKKGK